MPQTPRDEATAEDSAEQNQETDAYDPVEEAGLESFPASDPPAWSSASITGTTAPRRLITPQT